MYTYVFDKGVAGLAFISSYDGTNVIAIHVLRNMTESECEKLKSMTSEDLRNYLLHNI